MLKHWEVPEALAAIFTLNSNSLQSGLTRAFATLLICVLTVSGGGAGAAYAALKLAPGVVPYPGVQMSRTDEIRRRALLAGRDIILTPSASKGMYYFECAPGQDSDDCIILKAMQALCSGCSGGPTEESGTRESAGNAGVLQRVHDSFGGEWDVAWVQAGGEPELRARPVHFIGFEVTIAGDRIRTVETIAGPQWRKESSARPVEKIDLGGAKKAAANAERMAGNFSIGEGGLETPQTTPRRTLRIKGGPTSDFPVYALPDVSARGKFNWPQPLNLEPWLRPIDVCKERIAKNRNNDAEVEQAMKGLLLADQCDNSPRANKANSEDSCTAKANGWLRRFCGW